MGQLVESNSFEKFKVIASLPIFHPYFFFFFLIRFLWKSSKPRHGNRVLITWTVQVELSDLNFNFDNIRTNFLQVLTYYGFYRFCALMMILEQSRTELILTIKIKQQFLHVTIGNTGRVWISVIILLSYIFRVHTPILLTFFSFILLPNFSQLYHLGKS